MRIGEVMSSNLNGHLKSFAYIVVISVIVTVSIMFLSGYAQNTQEHTGVVRHQDEEKKQYIQPPEIPGYAEFAGEAVPLQNFDVKELLDQHLMARKFWHSSSMLILKRANRWFPVIEPILEKNGIPNDVKYLSVIETYLDNAVSPKGATGFWQFLEGTAKDYGLEVNREVDERYHIEKSTEAACRYLKDLKKKFGSWTMAAAAYNMGENGLERQSERQKSNNYYNLVLNDETTNYIFKIIAAKELIEHPEKFGFHLDDDDLYSPIEYKEIELKGSVEHFADWASNYGINYKILKLYNPWLRMHYLTNKSGKSYTIKLPVNGDIQIIPENLN